MPRELQLSMVNIVNYLFQLCNSQCSFLIHSESNPINIQQLLHLFIQLGMKYHCILYNKKGSRSSQMPAVLLASTTDCTGSLLGLLPNLCDAIFFLIPLHNGEEQLDLSITGITTTCKGLRACTNANTCSSICHQMRK